MLRSVNRCGGVWRTGVCHSSSSCVITTQPACQHNLPAGAACRAAAVRVSWWWWLQHRREPYHTTASKAKINDLLGKMPKMVDLTELQEQRLAKRNKLRKYPTSNVYLQVLGSGAPGAPRSLYVLTNHDKYLFNCGEGTQRLAHEHKVKLSTMAHILFTHKSWENVGGLPGMLLTLQDTGVPLITLHGPPGVASLHNDTYHFMRFKDLSIDYRHYEDDLKPRSDEPLSIQSVPLWANTEQKDELDDVMKVESVKHMEDEVGDLFAHEKGPRESMSRKRPIEKGDESTASLALKRKKLEESVSCRQLSVAYICRPPPKAGRLILELCVKAGVPAGPLLGELKNGKDVTLSDGRVVKAADVTGPHDPGAVFIVVEAPSEAYLDSLLDSPAFLPHQTSGGCEEDLAEVVVHFTPHKVLSSPRYQEWMARFPPSTSHLIINDTNSCMGSEAVHRMQYKLNLLHDDLFPLLRDSGIPKKDSSSEVSEKENSNEDCKKTIKDSPEDLQNVCDSGVSRVGPIVQASTLLTYHIRPRKKFDRCNVLELCPETYIQECYEGEKFESAFLDVKDKLKAMESVGAGNTSLPEYPCISFIGTGSCQPNKTRNTSGILLELSVSKAILLDCGEGTYGQLVRLLGSDKCEALLQRLVAVYVSHLHADHHIGLIRLLLARRKAFHSAGIVDVPKVVLMAPPTIMPYLCSYHKNFEPVLQDFTIVMNSNLLYNKFAMNQEDYLNLCSQLDMKQIEMSYVIHCRNSFGVAFTHTDGWKIVYSGDTMPCPGLVHIGQDCDVLIHEATLEDGMEEDAKIKTHCTTSQAIQVGKDMNARHTLLTHFSQRYARVPLLQELPTNVGIAFDNMKVRLSDLPSLHLLYDALVAMFPEHYEEMLMKAAKKGIAKERLEASKTTATAATHR